MQPRLVAVSVPDGPPPKSDTTGNQWYVKIGQYSDAYEFKLRQHPVIRRPSSIIALTKQRSMILRSKISFRQRPELGDQTQVRDGSIDEPTGNHARNAWTKLPPRLLRTILGYLEVRDIRLSPHGAEQKVRYDLMSVQLTCKHWFVEAQRCLYARVQIYDSGQFLPCLQDIRSSGRGIVLLRRTLRERPMLAKLVKHLHITFSLGDGYKTSLFTKDIAAWYPDLVATLVMACPNLERLSGIQPIYTHEFDKLVHALSTRTRLKQHSWLIGRNSDVTARSRTQSSGALGYEQSIEFLNHHIQWKSLERLKLSSFQGRGSLEHGLLIRALHSLPSLKDLRVVGFNTHDFSNATLFALPPLESLRLEYCVGITDAGLCQWAQKAAGSLTKELALLHLNLVSLLTISTVFACLPEMSSFRISQDIEPSLPLNFSVTQPLLIAKSLRKLRWEISEHPTFEYEHCPSIRLGSSDSLSAHQHVISSYLHQGLSNLESLRLGSDQDLAEISRRACSSTHQSRLLCGQSRPSQRSSGRRRNTLYSPPPMLPTDHTCPTVPPLPELPSDSLPQELSSSPIRARSTTSSSISLEQSRKTYHPILIPLQVSANQQNLVSPTSTSSHYTRSTRTVSTSDSESTAASSVSQTLSPLQPMSRAEDVAMGFNFGFDDITESTVQTAPEPDHSRRDQEEKQHISNICALSSTQKIDTTWCSASFAPEDERKCTSADTVGISSRLANDTQAGQGQINRSKIYCISNDIATMQQMTASARTPQPSIAELDSNTRPQPPSLAIAELESEPTTKPAVFELCAQEQQTQVQVPPISISKSIPFPVPVPIPPAIKPDRTRRYGRANLTPMAFIREDDTINNDNNGENENNKARDEDSNKIVVVNTYPSSTTTTTTMIRERYSFESGASVCFQRG